MRPWSGFSRGPGVPIDPGARIGAVHLRVADLDRLAAFYQACLGLEVRARETATARLGTESAELLVLHEDRSARRVTGTTGLYHFAILVPSRPDLARALKRLVDTSTRLQGAADHGVSEALYLADPEGNGIEIYRDRPRVEWPFVAGRLQMTTEPLDVQGLIAEADAAGERMAAGTTMGHVHLCVSDLAATEQFYAETLGFDLMQRFGQSAAFFSAGGYHHHIGANIWTSAGAPAPPPDALGLDYFEIVVPTPMSPLKDPSGNAMRFVARP